MYCGDNTVLPAGRESITVTMKRNPKSFGKISPAPAFAAAHQHNSTEALNHATNDHDTNSQKMNPLRLDCATQHYDWGKPGDSSIVGKLMSDTVEEDKCYAELWVGTHPKGPSTLLDDNKEKTNTPLSEHIRNNPNVLGTHEGNNLQFIFKVLSIEKPLSLKSHPNKEQAKLLHKKDPKNYPDDKHKPEMAIALTEFELLCGFQSGELILSNIIAQKDLFDFIGGEERLSGLNDTRDEQRQKQILKKIITQLWATQEDKVKGMVSEMMTSINLKDDRSPTDDLILRLNEQYNDDIGILAPIFLNYVKLQPGQAIFIAANEPYAYLSGDCVECMALSDSTVRAGLTSKFKDAKTFCENLTYQMSEPPVFEPNELPTGIMEYTRPTIDEFAVHKITEKVATLPSISAASFLVVIEGDRAMTDNNGNSHSLKTGHVLFLPQNFGDCALAVAEEKFLAFRSFTPPPK